MSSIEPVRRRGPTIPVSQGLALRVAILSGIAIAMFSVIAFRLWYLQVLSGEQYVQQADTNRVRDLPIAAPRGEILDREGQPIASSKTTNAVQIVPSALPEAGVVEKQMAEYREDLVPAEAARLRAVVALRALQATRGSTRTATGERAELLRLKAAAEHAPAVPVPALPGDATRARRLFSRLGRLLGMSAREIDEAVVRKASAVVYAPVTIKTDAGFGVLTEIGERANEYPGVIQQPVAIRSYPYGQMAAQVLGDVGSISEGELKEKAFRGVTPGTVVGQEGLEYYYDRYLRGKSGIQQVEVNAEGYPVPSKRLAPQQPEAGRSLRVTLDMGLQQEAEKALREAKATAQAGGKPAVAGAFMAMDPRNGEILAMGSEPGFDPNRFAKPLSPAEYKELEGSGGAPGPLTNRAVNGAYPTGSTFKPITAMAALEAGVLSPNEGLGAGSCITVGSAQQKFCNAGMADFGAVGLVEALKVSSDTYFFEVGERTNTGPIIQQEARKLGIGRPSNIDLPSEFPGVIPDAAWRQEQNEAQERCLRSKHKEPCQIVGEIKPWTVGENMNLALGQGDLLTDPLQMSVAYSILANAYTHGGEGWAPTPHLGKEIDEANGALLQSLSFPSRPVRLNGADVNLVMEGIHQAASQPGGTSTAVWQGWNQEQDPVYGKTGTAQHVGKEDQAWYMCYIGNSTRPIVIAVTVEEGGFGAETAAPVARLMASKYYGKPLKFVVGSSKTY